MSHGTEIAERAQFDLIRYAQVWEDADILVEALRPSSTDTVISIASAGDNAIALLAAGAERVIAADLSAAQLACVRLRIEAYRRLSHPELLELIGSRRSSRRAELLDRVAQGLSPQDQAFWKARSDQVVRHGAGGVGKFERYFRLFRRYALPLAHGRGTIAKALEPKDQAARAAFYDEQWMTPRWRMLMGAFFSRPVMGRLGRDPAFFDHAEGGVAAHVARRARQAMVEQEPWRNPYLAWILTGRHDSTLPRALREEHFDAIRSRLDRLELRQGPIEALVDEGIRADAFNLSDIFEYMSPGGHTDAYQAVLAAARPGARLAYWNMMAPRRVPASLADRVTPCPAVEAKLRPQDKAFFYSDFVVEVVK